MDIVSCLIYTTFLATTYVLARLTEKSGYDPCGLILTYLVVVLFWAIRYDIGYDYAGYVDIFEEIRRGASSYVEPGYYYLNRLFDGNPHGYVWVLAVMTVVTYFFLFKLFVREKILALGLFFSAAFQFQYMASSQVRQAAVVAIFLYLLRFLEAKKYMQYIVGVVICLLIHTSAVFLFLAIPLRKLRLSRMIWGGLVLVLYGCYLKGLFRTLGTSLITAFPLYEKYQTTDRILPEDLGFSIVMLWNIGVACYFLVYAKLINRPVLLNLYMVGVCMYCIFFEFHLLSRISAYFVYINIYLSALLCKNNLYYAIPLCVAAILVFILLSLKIPNLHGIFPYQTIFQRNII